MPEEKDPQTEIADLRAALTKANQEAAAARHELNELKPELDAAKAESGYRTRYLSAKAELALSSQGIKNPQRLVKMLDLEDIKEDDDGNLVGLDDKVSKLKNDFPEVFDTKRQVGRIDAENKDDPKVEKSTSEKQAEMLLGVQ